MVKYSNLHEEIIFMAIRLFVFKYLNIILCLLYYLLLIKNELKIFIYKKII